MLEEMTYKEVDGLLYPQIEMPDETEDLTKLGKVRKDGDELSKGERAGKIQDADEIREDVREDVSGRGGSEPAVRPVRDAVSGEAQATESVIDNGDVEDKRAGEDAGRGSVLNQIVMRFH